MPSSTTTRYSRCIGRAFNSLSESNPHCSFFAPNNDPLVIAKDKEALAKINQNKVAHSGRRKGALDLVRLLITAAAVDNHVHLLAVRRTRNTVNTALGPTQYLARGVRKPYGSG
jgi:hypothetical protein